MSQKLSAIVILSNDNVDRVFIVPEQDASLDNIERLRQQVQAKGVQGIKVQHVAYDRLTSSSPLASMEDASQYLDTLSN